MRDDGKRMEVYFLRLGRFISFIFLRGGVQGRGVVRRFDGKRMEVYFLRAGRCVTLKKILTIGQL